MIEAQIILDSISSQGIRLTTFSTRYPKGIIHGEVMTHRKFSRNASSSRAIPVKRYIEEVMDAQRAAPEYWGAEQKGMQSGGELDDVETIFPGPYIIPLTKRARAKTMWGHAANLAVTVADQMVDLGVHKSIVNRLLDPFIHIRTLITSDHYGLLNFFGLRLDKAAQPEIRILAERMWAAWNESKPRLLQPGEWHLPFVDAVGGADVSKVFGSDAYLTPHPLARSRTLDVATKVSVARCARVSYNSFETGKRSTVEEDLKLYDRLVGAAPMHASPTEHQATPDEFVSSGNFVKSHGTDPGKWKNTHQHGNFVGWRQFRKFLEGESCAPLPEGYIYTVRQ